MTSARAQQKKPAQPRVSRWGAPLLGVAVALATVVFFVLIIEAMAFGTWKLSPSAGADLAALRTRPTFNSTAVANTDNNRIEEWPADAPRAFKDSPLLHGTAFAKLPPVAERLPENPLVVRPFESTGIYGGTWQMYGTDAADISTYISARICYDNYLRWSTLGDKLLLDLASDYKVSNDSRTFTVMLRKGVRWSDGEPFNAADIAFWYNDVFLNDDITPAKTREFKQDKDLATFKVIDPYTVQFTFARPNGLFLTDLAMGANISLAYPAHYLKHFHANYRDLDELTAEAKDHGFASWSAYFNDRCAIFNVDCPRLWAWVFKVPPPKQPVILERNPYYWKVDPQGNQLPYIDGITMNILDPEIINMRAINGEIGVQGRHLRVENYPLYLQKQAQGGYTVNNWIAANGGVDILGVNQNHPDKSPGGMCETFRDDRVRQALSLAINRPEINQICFFGLGTPRQPSPPHTSAFYDANYSKAFTQYDVAEANRLLDEAGLAKRDSRGMRLLPNGKPLNITLECIAMSSDLDVLQLIAEYWSKVGIKTDVKSEARSLFYARKDASLDDVAVWYGADEQNPMLDPRWLLPFTKESLFGVGYTIWFQTHDPLDPGKQKGEEPPPDMKRCYDLYTQAKATGDVKQQIALFQQIQELNRKHLWVIGTIGELPEPFLVKNTFRNVPRVAISGWSFRTPGNASPEVFAIDPSKTGTASGVLGGTLEAVPALRPGTSKAVPALHSGTH
jgi:peptide/nickel transport system substrate-binding protein